MTSKIYRTAGSIKNGTVAAASYAGSTLAYVAPHMAGAIDILVVEQPDGTLKSSPFYVRFGKYTGMRSTDRHVHITVNDVQADVTMHLGRSGEAYFVGEDAIEGDSEDEDLPRVMADPHTINTQVPLAAQLNPDHPIDLHAATVAEVAAEEPANNLRPSHSTSSLASLMLGESSIGTSLSAPPGDPTICPHTFSPGTLNALGLAPARPCSTGTSSTDSELEVQDGITNVASSSTLATLQSATSRSSSAHSLLTESLAAVKQREDDRRASHAHASPSGSGSASESSHVTGSRTPPQRGSRSRSRRSLQLRRALPTHPEADPTPPFSEQLQQVQSPGQPCHKDSSQSSHLLTSSASPESQGQNTAQSADTNEKRLQQVLTAAAGQDVVPQDTGTASFAEKLLDGLLPAKNSSEADEDEAPKHPWSVSNPRFLGTPAASQPPTSTMHAADASAPVGHSSAAAAMQSPLDPASSSSPQQMPLSTPLAQPSSAIPAMLPKDHDADDGSPQAGNRVELEALHDQLYHKGESAPIAMHEAHKERLEWEEEGGEPPVQSEFGKEVAITADLAAAAAAVASVHTGSSSSDSSSLAKSLTAEPPATTGMSGPKAQFPNTAASKELSSSNGSPQNRPSSPQLLKAPKSALLRQHSQSAPTSPTAPAKVTFQQLGSNPGYSRSSPFARAAARNAGQGLQSSPHSQLGVQDASQALQAEPGDDDTMPGSERTTDAPNPDRHSQAMSSQSDSGKSLGITSQHRSTSTCTDMPASSVTIPNRSSAAWQNGFPTSSSVTGSSLGGMSPPDGYLADSERFAGGRSPSPTGLIGAVPGFELSLCAPHISSSTSPEEASRLFAAHRVSEAQLSQQGSQLAADPALMCRLGSALYPWQDVAPAVMGALAFGWDWQHMLPAGGGIPVKVPASEARQLQLDARKAKVAKSSSWRGWLGSWRSGSGGQGSKSNGTSMDAAVAAAAAATAQPLETTQQLAVEALQSQLSPTSSRKVSELVATQQKQLEQHRRRSFAPTAEQLQGMNLQPGQNNVDFSFAGQRLRAYIYCCSWNSRLVVSDIDGTITKSDLLGHLLPRVGFDWSHRGVTRLFTNIKANGYVFMFLSSRAIAQASATRDYLHTLNQDGETLPAGPVIISPDGLFPSLYRELVLRRPHEFKIRCLQDIRALFPPEWNPFYAGFGNRDTDEISYLTVGVPASKCFIINPQGELKKASSAVATSTWASLTSVNNIVQSVFPPLREAEPNSAMEREEYNDYNYWHVTPPIIIDSEDDAFGDPEGQQSDGDYDDYQDDDVKVLF